jgi:hypothetical protein
METVSCAHCLMVIIDSECAICRREWSSYDDLHKTINELRDNLIATEKINSILREELNNAKASAAEAINNVRTVFAHREDVWFWQGEGNDPESLSCPVVLNADTARKLVAVINAAQTWSDAVEAGFAAEVRPDIARTILNRALAALNKKEDH